MKKYAPRDAAVYPIAYVDAYSILSMLQLGSHRTDVSVYASGFPEIKEQRIVNR